MKIIHIADIHWRGLSRHQEYKDSFSSFFKKSQSLNPDVIYVGGDIVHSKTQGISPELIDSLGWWFTELAKIAPTHIILGNHDGLIMNKDRQDAISPIITALDNPNLHLYKKSGTYPTGIPGFNWCVFSCFDEKNWQNVCPVKGDVNIALFHGAVWGSKTDIDWDIEGDITSDFFNDFDFALLGDIHRQQYLGEDKKIAYSGSTIQQNYGEGAGKGFLFWDIEDKDKFTSEFYEISHSMPFITIDWKGSVAKTISSSKKSPPGARFRVKSNLALPQSDIIQLHSELKHVKNASEVVFKVDEAINSSKIKIGKDKIFKKDLRDFNTQLSLMKEYYQNAEIDSSEWERIEKLIKLYLSQVSRSDEVSRNIKWSIKKLKFDNLFSYGKNNIIDFDSLSGITGIFGKNRSGKSSIVGALMYALFNTTDRGPIKNIHIINSRKGHCLAQVDVNINGKNYRIERQSVKHESRKGDISATTHLNFFQIDDKGEILRDLTEEQRRETEKVLRKMIGTSDDFLMTSLASQGEMNTFIKERATARKMILTKFLDLNIFDKMSQLARDDSSEIKAQMRNAPDRDWDVMIYDISQKIKKKKGDIKEIEKKIDEKRDSFQKVQMDLASCGAEDLITPDDILRTKAAFNKTRLEIKGAQDNLSLFENLVDDISEKIFKIEKFKSQFSIEEVRKRIQIQGEMEKSLIKIQGEHEQEKSKLENQERSIKKLEGIPCGDSFLTCKFIKDSYRDKAHVDQQRERIEKTLSNIIKIQKSLKELCQEKLSDKIEKYNEIIKKESELRISLSETNLKRHECQTKLKAHQTQLKKDKKTLSEMKVNVATEDLNEKIVNLKEKSAEISSEIDDFDSSRISLAQSIGKFQNELSITQKEKKRFIDLKTQWKVYSLFLQAVSKKGIPLQIIMSQLPIINSEISRILQNTVGFTVELEADENSNAMDIYINYGDSRRVIELASGMEKMISSLAIRVALINTSSLAKTDMLIIDEGFGSLDEMNVETCNRLLESLKTWFRNILIISHVDAVKDAVDSVVDITRKGKDSHVKVM